MFILVWRYLYGQKKISFSEFMSELKKSAESYFECKCISENYDDNAIAFVA